ncbi:trimeric intracellular cation channel family protein [Sulfurovum sp. bin170]|uniref:trimeric intracellular cation channel family protein n=1 Tax=Sulfurovum sp. bin170 TaxID=2695268 RepID=UPI0013DF0998|nr:trimeric intracellular cation channel family protein [Sulfurovum sp. bin170]NEW60661.1 trimeric intracellular cation channel family protein [Sulfurovum sp. bin170]
MFEITEYIGIIAFAISGFFVGARNRLDFLGVLISVFLTALGGGIIRDILVDKTPYTFIHTAPAVTILVVMILLILFKFHKKESIENKPWFIISDSIGLISFSITGALIAIENHLNITGVLVLSFITAVGGGIIRDVIINEVPFIFKTGFYGTVSLLVGFILYILSLYEQISFPTLLLVFLLGVSIRLLAYYRHWSIPLK